MVSGARTGYGPFLPRYVTEIDDLITVGFLHEGASVSISVN
jgi:hypothetical protein